MAVNTNGFSPRFGFLIPMALLLIREPVVSGVWQTAKSGFVVVAMGLNGKPDR